MKLSCVFFTRKTDSTATAVELPHNASQNGIVPATVAHDEESLDLTPRKRVHFAEGTKTFDGPAPIPELGAVSDVPNLQIVVMPNVKPHKVEDFVELALELQIIPAGAADAIDLLRLDAIAVAREPETIQNLHLSSNDHPGVVETHRYRSRSRAKKNVKGQIYFDAEENVEEGEEE
ncbi:hypothetical protein HK102_011807 [Quaeritorhiza haematococci]|nr:hypothetical protein HK102_011807 [Quaeritorhiza haematococci]